MNRVPDEERYRRVVEEGSNRKRDLAGYHRVRAGLESHAREQAVARMKDCGADLPTIWEAAADRLRASVPAPTFSIWLEPLEPAGVDGETLFLTAPEGIRTWTERRYSSLIAEALQACSSFTRVSFAAPEVHEGPGVAV